MTVTSGVKHKRRQGGSQAQLTHSTLRIWVKSTIFGTEFEIWKSYRKSLRLVYKLLDSQKTAREPADDGSESAASGIGTEIDVRQPYRRVGSLRWPEEVS